MQRKFKYIFGYLMWNEFSLRLRRIVRRAWCRKYEFWEETSIYDPNGIWQGLDYKVVEVTVMVPFWVKDIDEYINNAEPSLIYI